VEQATEFERGSLTASRSMAAIARDAASEFVDVWIARVLLTAALALVLGAGVHHALDQPIYGPIDEAYHTAYVQKVAATGFPPKLGRDTAVLAPHKTWQVGQVQLPAPEAATAGLPYGSRFELAQNEAIQPPLYYYILAPIVWFTSGHDLIYALRIASCILEAIGILLLYAMLRERIPRMPLAAGIAAVVMASMTGITQLLSEVQNDALLLPLCVLLFWVFLRDLEQRRVSWQHGLVAGAVAATQLIVVPLGLVSLITAALYANRGFPRWPALRRLWLPAILYVAPLGSWVLLNLSRYHGFLPVSSFGPDSVGASNTAGELFSRSFQLLNTAEAIIVQTAYVPMWPMQPPDTRPVGLLLVSVFVALALVLLRGRSEQRTIGLWILLAVVSFVLIFYAALINAARAGSTGEISGIFVARYFLATLAAISAAVGITITAGLAGYDLLRRVASVALCAGLIYFSISASSLWHV
jgi:4-amino-4-deoxy-L-arabinose transferase-like glycosyltransferase